MVTSTKGYLAGLALIQRAGPLFPVPFTHSQGSGCSQGRPMTTTAPPPCLALTVTTRSTLPPGRWWPPSQHFHRFRNVSQPWSRSVEQSRETLSPCWTEGTLRLLQRVKGLSGSRPLSCLPPTLSQLSHPQERVPLLRSVQGPGSPHTGAPAVALKPGCRWEAQAGPVGRVGP